MPARSRSIKNKIAEFQACVDIEKPHIIAITESWLDDSFNDGEVFPTEYSVFRNDTNTTHMVVVLLWELEAL